MIGTPDDLVEGIRHLQEVTGGFGVVLGFAHDWANREATLRSWDLMARYVIPEINGTTAGIRESQAYLNANQAELMAGASKAVVSKILENEKRPRPWRPRWNRPRKPPPTMLRRCRSSAPARASRRPTDARTSTVSRP